MESNSAIADRLPAMTSPVGAAVRSRRQALGLTLEVLARGSGVSRAMLSDVERGNRSPTINILSQIAVGLGCRVADLIEEPLPDRPVLLRADQHPLVLDATSGVERHTLPSPWLAPGLELVRYVLPPGSSMLRSPTVVRYHDAEGRRSGPYPPNPQGSREHVCVEAGRVHYRGGGLDVTLRLGDTLAYRLVGEFSYHNPGRAPCRLALLLDTQTIRGA